MEITEIETAVLESPVDAASLPAQVGDRSLDISSVLVRIHTDEGITGLGESFYRSVEDNLFLERSIRSMARHLVGKDPRNVKKHWHELYLHVKRAGAYGALSALDEAMWDIKGKNAGQPLYELLGGECGDIHAYATFPAEKEIDELIEDAHWLADKGFVAMKVGAGFGVEEDRERIREIQTNTPDEFGLAIDANTSYDFPDALRVAKTASEYELEWFEEPIAHTDISGQADLNRKVTVPISGYQTHTPHYPAVDHLKANALEIYQPSLDYAGGVTGATRVADLVEAFGKQLIPHALGPAVNYAASLHVAAASRACERIEFAVLVDDIDDPGEYVGGPHIANQDDIRVEDGGEITPPEGPGLGIEIDEDVLAEYTVSTSS
ncbi:mandelate racemase/muconate lactonizing enzyme family protein [Halalkalicoccus sp. NIPERK01]|uniref:mandelate racemase/muconate lactonizing enzyme family protein n=1 Tax=Halalkalicoccus sp. NIPERK01 TaxID=3053469 RepID=UPI00256F13CE|nr:mandelate racemase/muconate lactonizing enzyme family protein [Halalkalicoccus sp. NIPERK01]MDL5363469.1 mandelate racemase/muconate lactonizing enzyme family protein [Halalkalicoccus sp. NIPERK01]